MTKRIRSFQDVFDEKGELSTGFDYARIVLSISVLVWHSLWVSKGSQEQDIFLWSSHFRFIPALIIPLFFSLSGFLVAGSLARNRLDHFILLRCIRLLPALTVEIILYAFIIGPLFTFYPLKIYLKDPDTYEYLLNILGIIQYKLPGLFKNNPSDIVNGQLWTIPYELECYLVLVVISFAGFTRYRLKLLIGLCLICTFMTGYSYLIRPVSNVSHVPGRALVLFFLCGVLIYVSKDKLPYSNIAGIVAGVQAAIFLQVPNLSYLAPLPTAYLIAWIGLMRLRKIPFGDLSYGIFLFHYPIQQCIMHVLVGDCIWWLLVLLSLPLSMLCAYLSWKFIESPALNKKKIVLRTYDYWRNKFFT